MHRQLPHRGAFPSSFRLSAALALAALCGCSSAEPAPNAAPPEPDPRSERPTALELHAWQIEERVLVVARGENPTGGYDTALVPADGGALRLHNVPPDGPAIQVITPFELSAWIEADEPLPDVAVRVADATERVPVVQAPRLRSSD